MSQRLVIITEIISPYRIPLFNDLARGSDPELHVIFLAETDPSLRQWNVYKEEIDFSFEVLPSWRTRIGRSHLLLNRGVARALKHAKPDVILCGGYNYPAAWQALLWARRHHIPFLLWSESHARDMRAGRGYVELLKSNFVSLCSGFVVPGKAACEYLQQFGVDKARIFTAVNAVDNSFFCKAAATARSNASQLRGELGLPERYFVFAGRLVREKGVFELLAAYAELDADLRSHVGLVFVGDGPCRKAIEQRAASVSPGMIRFVGFVQREQLSIYYALAETFILPTYTDTWGLVVNEAMACGLPIIVSDIAGCATDLVTENWNGKIVPSKDIEALASAMSELMRNAEARTSMGMNSARRIAEYSAQQWSAGIVEMVQTIGVACG